MATRPARAKPVEAVPDLPETAQDDEVTLQWREPPPITYGAKRKSFPYEQAAEMLADKPGKWMSLRTGPANRMDQFKTRFQSKVGELLPEDWAVECTNRTVSTDDNVRVVEVFARIINITGETA